MILYYKSNPILSINQDLSNKDVPACGVIELYAVMYGLWKSDAAVWTAVQGYGFFFYACSAHCWFIHALLQLFSPIHKWISHS